jgi:hypothetical protein
MASAFATYKPRAIAWPKPPLGKKPSGPKQWCCGTLVEQTDT